MAQVMVSRLIFDVTTTNRETALDLQNHISACSEKVTACLESILAPFDDPNYHLVLDRVQLDIETLDSEHLEEDLLRSIRKTLNDQLEMLLVKQTEILGQNKPEASFSKETGQEYEQELIKYFLETGYSKDHSTEQFINGTQIKKMLYESPSVGQWILSAQEENPEVLTRLLFHLDDSEILELVLDSSFMDIAVLAGLINVMSTDIEAAGKARSNVWKHLFIQKNTGVSNFDSPVFFKSIESQCSFPAHKYVNQLPRQVLDKLLPENYDYFTPFLGKLSDSTSILAGEAIQGATLDRVTGKIETEGEINSETFLKANPGLGTSSHLSEKKYIIDPINQLSDEVIQPVTPDSLPKDSNVHLDLDQQKEQTVSEPDLEPPVLNRGASNNENSVLASGSRKEKNSKDLFQLKQESEAVPVLGSPPETEFETEAAAIYLLDQDEPETPKGTRFYLHNAGIILIAPFLGNFFKHLGLLEQGQFIHEEAQQRAVVLMHYFYPQHEVAEDALVLHKILCGLPIKHPVPVNLEPTESELTEINDLLHSLIQYWDTLQNTSVESFKYNFLNRKAVLVNDEAQWQLTIQHESIDVLLSTLPWSIEVVKHDWMKKPIMVEW